MDKEMLEKENNEKLTSNVGERRAKALREPLQPVVANNKSQFM